MQSVRRTDSTRTIVEAYECPMEACTGNNTCKGDRIGLLCGYCPEDRALELNVCVECGGDASVKLILQIMVGVFALGMLFLVLFLVGWRHVFPENIVHNTFDKVQGMIFSQLERVASCFRKKGDKGKVNPANARSAIQFGKIFFAYYQVITAFIRFKVPLPDILQTTIRYLHAIGKVLSFDVFEYPGMGCLVGMEWSQQLVIRTSMPLAILILMVVPVVVSQLRLRSIKTLGSDAAEANDSNMSPESRRELQLKRLKARDNLEQTCNTCWNNCLSWLFLVFPSMTLASMEAFSCQRIGNQQYLSADLQELCPSSSDGMFWFSVFMTAVWAVGTPTLIMWSMIHHDVPMMVSQKTQQSVVYQMLDRYSADSVDSGRRTIANSIGKRVTRLGDCAGDEEVERRSADLYQTLFPDHAECENGCEGHALPKLCAAILKRVRSLSGDGSFFKPAGSASGTKMTLPDFKSAIRKWFEYIDINLNSLLDRQELRREFGQLGLGDTEADSLLMHFDFDGNEQLDIREFEAGMLHILDSSIPGLRSTEVLFLFSSLPEVDSNSPISFEHFQYYLKGWCREALVFTGAERAESLTGQQLLALLDHTWKRYNKDIGDDEVDMKIEAGMDVVKDALENVEAALSDAKRREPTEQEERMLRQCKDICRNLKISADNVDIQNATVWDLPEVFDVMIEALDSWLPASFIGAAANSDTSHIFRLRHIIIVNKGVFTGLLLQDVEQLGLSLLDEGVLTISPLEWDGALGPSEVNVIDRLGFLLDAYQASVWYWEVVEMVRKLILTSLLVVIYDGSAPHLFGSLITTFIFTIAHLKVHPYLNRRLNDFQRLALITQFLTILGCIIYLMVQTLNDLHEVKPSEEDPVASYLLALFILAINWLTGVIYPMYRIVLIVMNSDSSLSAMIGKYMNRLFRITGAIDEGPRNKPLGLMTTQQERSARDLFPQGFRRNRTEVPLLRKRVRAAAADLSEDNDEIQAAQRQSTQGRAFTMTGDIVMETAPVAAKPRIPTQTRETPQRSPVEETSFGQDSAGEQQVLLISIDFIY